MWPRRRDRHLHRRSQHQLHERLQRLLQVLRVLPHGKGRRPLRAHARADRQKIDELTADRRHADSDAGRPSSEARHRLLSRLCSRTSGRNIRTSTSTASARRSSTISREVFGMPLREVIAQVQGGRARLDSRRRRRNPRGPRARAHRAAEMQERPLAGSDGDRARAGAELERDDDVRPRRDARGPHRASAAAARQQDETGGFTAFICWTFQPENTELESRDRSASAEYLRMQALSRIYLDNFENVQSSWVTQGPKIGQVALKLRRERFRQRDDGGERGLQAGTTFRLKRRRSSASSARRATSRAGGTTGISFSISLSCGS